jgi:hypothetical protein
LRHSGVGSIDGPHRSRVIGNGLRELDRFLNVLLDEVAAATGWVRADLQRLGRQRNTANKLGAVYGATTLPPDLLPRLRALARNRDCLFYNDGWVRRGDTRAASAMTTGWPAPSGEDGLAIALGERLFVCEDTLAWICDLYRRIADDLIRDICNAASQQDTGRCRPQRPQ